MKQIDLSIIISSLACQFILFGLLAVRTPQNTIDVMPDNNIEPMRFERILPLPSDKEEIIEEDHHAELEESPTDISFLFYATVPIGRYYITAYNHKETGSKITASGKTVHQGTITTCAIDPKLHRFGEYFEITVNGEPRLFVAEDTGRLVKKKHVDLYFSSYKEMARFGSNYQTIYKVTFPFGKPKDN